MIKILFSILAVLVMTSCSSDFAGERGEKIVIAHRGASGYLPEHSLASKSMAHAMGADYIEQDLVMTKDDQVVVFHDLYLGRVTNVTEVYPDRKRKDGRYYVIDFTLDELKRLELSERYKIEQGKHIPDFPQRFPLWKSSFRIHTFAEEIELIKGLNKSTGKSVGIYPEIKGPWFHRIHGKDISKKVLEILKQYGYTAKDDLVYLQCFDPNELKRIRGELFPEFDIEIKLIQLIAETDWGETMIYQEGKMVPYDYSWMLQTGGMDKISQYADGVGPWMGMIVENKSISYLLSVTDIVKDAHNAGLQVHPYTFRLDSGYIPNYASDFDDLLDIFYFQIGVDGVFTDFPDRAVDFLGRMEAQQ
jgi:glycerophosphoryl diester phosphodiesterase